jgi:hypothetical protein
MRRVILLDVLRAHLRDCRRVFKEGKRVISAHFSAAFDA